MYVCMCVCVCVCLSAFSDKTTEPILTNDGSVQPLGPWSGRNGPGFFNFDPELAKKAENGPKWTEIRVIGHYLPKYLTDFDK